MTPPDPRRGRLPTPARRAASRDRASFRDLSAQAGAGWALAVELVVATLTWGGIGWLLDAWLGTAPWLMVIGFVVGNGAGIYLIWLRTNEIAEVDAAARTVARDARRAERRAGERSSGPLYPGAETDA